MALLLYIITNLFNFAVKSFRFVFVWCPCIAINNNVSVHDRSTPVAQLAPRNLLTRWDVSSIPANGIFLTKN